MCVPDNIYGSDRRQIVANLYAAIHVSREEGVCEGDKEGCVCSEGRTSASHETV